MTVNYMAVKANDSNRVLGIGIAGEQGGMDYPIQGDPKIGKWIDYVFTELPNCNEDTQHIEFNETLNGFIAIDDTSVE